MCLEFFVYAYIRQKSSSTASAGTPYYIGKGKGSRAFDKHKDIPVPEDRSRILFLETNLTELGALAIERRLIRWYGRKDIGSGILLNRTDGGDGVRGLMPSLEARKKMSESQKARAPASEITRAKLSAANKGKPKSEETKTKLRNAKIGKSLSEEHKDKIRAGVNAAVLKYTPETRKKMATAKGRIVSAETRAKLSAANKGKIVSAETKEKLRQANLGKKRRPTNSG